MELARIPINVRPFAPISAAPAREDAPAALASSFSQMLSSALKQVNDLQVQADDLAAKLATGEVSDAHTVMIASEKATLALQLTLQIRNKVIEAYQEIMRMQL
ncbi:MAG: flagellar hook-basal body complex protein FliE [Chloroflexota bacterium]